MRDQLGENGDSFVPCMADNEVSEADSGGCSAGAAREAPAQLAEVWQRLTLPSGFLLLLQRLNGVFVRADGKRVKI